MIVSSLIGLVLGVGLAALITLLFGVYSIGPTERGVLTTFGRVQRLDGNTIDDPQLGALLNAEEKQRYNYPNIRVISPGGPFFKWPWQKLYKIDMTIQAIDITWDPDIRQETIEAVTKDNLTVQITGQIRWKPAERNLYAYLFGVAHPAAHVVGYFISVLRDRIATFHGEDHEGAVEGVSINDLRRNLSLINTFMEESCRKTSRATASTSMPPSSPTSTRRATSTRRSPRSTRRRTRSPPPSARPRPTLTRNSRWPNRRCRSPSTAPKPRPRRCSK